MKKVSIYFMYITIISLMVACNFNRIYINREEDNEDGVGFLENFYGKINNKDYNGINTMVGDSLKRIAGADGIAKMVKFINTKMGNYKTYYVVDHYIKAVTGSTNEISYNYKLKVTYDKGVVDEIIGFKKHDGSEIKLNSYHANSDLLLQ